MRLPIGSLGKVRREQKQALGWVELGHCLWEGRERMGMGSEER